MNGIRLQKFFFGIIRNFSEGCSGIAINIGRGHTSVFHMTSALSKEESDNQESYNKYFNKRHTNKSGKITLLKINSIRKFIFLHLTSAMIYIYNIFPAVQLLLDVSKVNFCNMDTEYKMPTKRECVFVELI